MTTMNGRPQFPQKAIVTAGMPYGNKGLHFGHIGGVFVPADLFARFLRNRIGADNVVFVSGTDCYGSPIDEGYRKAVEAGTFSGTLTDYVEANHEAQAAAMRDYEISLDLFEGSGLGICKAKHEQVTADVIRRLHDNDFLEKRATAQFYDEKAGCFLNGRQVVGRCPVQGCKSEKAYADECDLGHQYMPADLIAPKSTITGETPAMRDVSNWYFKLPDFAPLLRDHVAYLESRSDTRKVVTDTISEFLVPPVLYIKNELEGDYRVIAASLPAHEFHAAEKGKASFELEFPDVESRDVARAQLSRADIRFRGGKALVPFRITGNISWGVPAPQLDDDGEKLTVWCWPESLWAPISFTRAYLEDVKGCSDDEWRNYWCSRDGRVYQFIGQDNIYFYGVAQTAMWSALQTGHAPRAEADAGELQQSTLIANYHVLFMNKKASSSGAIKPPMAIELLDHYTPEQLRAHFLALGLGMKSVSFQPKPYDPAVTAPDADPEKIKRMADPALKESALLNNVFNRFARGCFYAAREHENGTMPLGGVKPRFVELVRDTALEYEQAMARFEFWRVMTIVDAFLREVAKYWNDASRSCRKLDTAEAEPEAAGGAIGTDAASRADAAWHELLVNAFYLLRAAAMLVEPIAPSGCRMIIDYFDLGDAETFLSWEHIFDEGFDAFTTDQEKAAGAHAVKELPPRTDFFEKHPSQFE